MIRIIQLAKQNKEFFIYTSSKKSKDSVILIPQAELSSQTLEKENHFYHSSKRRNALTSPKKPLYSA